MLLTNPLHGITAPRLPSHPSGRGVGARATLESSAPPSYGPADEKTTYIPTEELGLV